MTALTNKTALITGASKGIGKAMALMFADAGADVAISARSADALREIAARIESTGRGRAALAIAADMSSASEVQRIAEEALARFGTIDILVNNAAIIHAPIDLVDFDPELWRQVLEVNLTGAAMLSKALLPGMIAKGSGKIINIASIGGRRGAKGRSAYRVTKAGLISLTESLAAEVRQHGIDVNCICPGGVDTEGYREAFSSRGRQDNPKLMLPEEIAEVALFLASDASSAITGSAIDAFGGTNPLFA